MSVASPLIVALDYADAKAAYALAERLDPRYCRVKVGKELFTAAGPQAVETLQAKGFECFLDLKFHDIPATVAKAVAAAAQLGVWMVNVHASGGLPMMQEAKAALGKFSSPPLLIAVTVLTSMSQEVFAQTGFAGAIADRVSFLARLAAEAGLDGVVCSALEARAIKQQAGAALLAVTPGIRPLGADNQDQSRVLTPSAALEAGTDYLVVGRPITQAADPAQACYELYQSLNLDA
ncbi:MAG TPA: orotidine-5'-phosphate decarboxylase [Cellvibrionaceae bacterium]|nr:orotidine-5'-phosphate decarboxylase [Cellvibrionaceae bacterium]